MRLRDLETPCVLVDEAVLVANIRRMQALANSRGVALRPHIKTHKCLEIAALQVAEGAVGITASKCDEALVFISGGFRSVTVAYPILDPTKLDRLFAAARSHGAELRFIADSEAGADALAAVAARHDTILRVLLKIDVGLHRCGVREDAPTLIRLARRIQSSASLRFAGLLSHAGHAYAASNRDGVTAVAREECAILSRVRRRLTEEGIPVEEVSVGSTPTVLASDAYEGITEVRPGNYVFLDRTCIRLGLATAEQVSLSVLATVVSANNEYLIVDAGSKVLSSDLGAHGTGGALGYGTAYPLDGYRNEESGVPVVRLSEEHGFLRRERTALGIGSRVRIIPNHACPVANLASNLVVLRGGQPPLRWKVAARGCVL
jgi:D-serine deaminase-like pyridoxal phosphate-dependent protein